MGRTAPLTRTITRLKSSPLSKHGELQRRDPRRSRDRIFEGHVAEEIGGRGRLVVVGNPAIFRCHGISYSSREGDALARELGDNAEL